MGLCFNYSSNANLFFRLFTPELLWTSPELLRDPETINKGTQKGDVFSFAIIMAQLIGRGPPYNMPDMTAQQIIGKVRKPPPLCRPKISISDVPPAYMQLIKRAWSEQPEVRPSFDELNQQIKAANRGKDRLELYLVSFYGSVRL
ncbi:unnamed protein product [Protopolystoma xenopodis]|uniref:guanylate cyclase n=1 Tax=Protopolystoma xenopodis TaxID=117903 RepID=A0A448XIH6_9PLAT|nr:unnamed protein product [Protopolystoma xenopodis]